MYDTDVIHKNYLGSCENSKWPLFYYAEECHFLFKGLSEGAGWGGYDSSSNIY